MSKMKFIRIFTIGMLIILTGLYSCVSYVAKPGMSKEDFLKNQGKEPTKKINKGGYEIWIYDKGIIVSQDPLLGSGWNYYGGNIVFFKDGKYIANRFIDLDKIRDDYLDDIINKKIVIGMTKDEVIYSWDKPTKINETVGKWGVHEQWIYGSFPYVNKILYFENGILTGWQDM